jgi:hypothetical protein
LKIRKITETRTAPQILKPKLELGPYLRKKQNPNQTRTDPFKNVRNWNQNVPPELGNHPTPIHTYYRTYLTYP